MEKEKSKHEVRRTSAVLKLEDGREIPLTVSCRRDGECVILPRSMDEIIFPSTVKSKKEKTYKLRK